MTSWVAIDFETANARRASPCSVGLVKVKEGQIVEEWSSFIKPPPGHDHFDQYNVRIHGITANHVRDAPGWRGSRGTQAVRPARHGRAAPPTSTPSGDMSRALRSRRTP